MSVAFSPDGSVLASAGGGAFLDGDTAIRIWSLPKGNLLRKITGHKKQVTCVVFSPDGKTLAACSEEAVRLWRVGDGKRLLTIEEDYGNTAQFSSDGTQLLSGTRMYRTTDGEQLGSLGEDRGAAGGRFRVAALMPGSDQYVSVTTESWQICRIDHGKPVLDVPITPAPKHVFGVQLSVDGLRLAISGNWGEKNRIEIFDTETGTPLWATDTAGGVRSLRFHPSGKLLAAGLSNGIVLLRSADGEIAARAELPEALLFLVEAHGIAFSSDGKQVAAACSDAVVRLWEVQLNG
jgi:WD40 repeat protein